MWPFVSDSEKRRLEAEQVDKWNHAAINIWKESGGDVKRSLDMAYKAGPRQVYDRVVQIVFVEMEKRL